MNVFMYRIDDRAYGFRVVALVAEDEAQGAERIRSYHRGRFIGDPHKRGVYVATLVDQCAVRPNAYSELEFEE